MEELWLLIMPKPDPHVNMTASNFRLRLMEKSFERAHLFWDGPSILDLDTLGLQCPQKESDGIVHLFGLDKELLGHGDHPLVGLL